MLSRSFVSIGAATMILVPAVSIGRVSMVPSQVPQDVISSQFRGEITYEGSYEGRESLPARRSRGRSALNFLNLGGDYRSFDGRLSATLVFDGDRVRGTFRTTGILNGGAFTGTRRGGECQLIDSRTGEPWTARCDANGFVGDMRSPPGARKTLRVSYQMTATRLVNYASPAPQVAGAPTPARRCPIGECVRFAYNPVKPTRAQIAQYRPLVLAAFNQLDKAYGFSEYYQGRFASAAYQIESLDIGDGPKSAGYDAILKTYYFVGGEKSNAYYLKLRGNFVNCYATAPNLDGCVSIPTDGQAAFIRSIPKTFGSGARATRSPECAISIPDQFCRQ